MTAKPATIDEYLAGLPGGQRAALEALRAQIRKAAPAAEECISYSVPAFRQGRLLVGFSAATKHCSFHLMSTGLMEAFAEELRNHDTGKGTVRFRPEAPLSADLVRRLVAARLEENARLDQETEARRRAR